MSCVDVGFILFECSELILINYFIYLILCLPIHYNNLISSKERVLPIHTCLYIWCLFQAVSLSKSWWHFTEHTILILLEWFFKSGYLHFGSICAKQCRSGDSCICSQQIKQRLSEWYRACLNASIWFDIDVWYNKLFIFSIFRNCFCEVFIEYFSEFVWVIFLPWVPLTILLYKETITYSLAFYFLFVNYILKDVTIVMILPSL